MLLEFHWYGRVKLRLFQFRSPGSYQLTKVRNMYIPQQMWRSSSSSSQQRAAVVNTCYCHQVLPTRWPISPYKCNKNSSWCTGGVHHLQCLHLPLSADPGLPKWWETSQDLGRLLLLSSPTSCPCFCSLAAQPTLCWNCVTAGSQSSPWNCSGSFYHIAHWLTQEILGSSWLGRPSVLRQLVIWWAISCLQEVKGYHNTTGFSSCPQGNRHMKAHKVIPNKVIPLAQASCRSQQPSPSHLLAPEKW